MPRQNDDNSHGLAAQPSPYRPAKLILGGHVLATGSVNLATKTFLPNPWQPLDSSPKTGAVLTLLETGQAMETGQAIPNVKISSCDQNEPHYHLEIPS
jgi:hypothetical protein